MRLRYVLWLWLLWLTGSVPGLAAAQPLLQLDDEMAAVDAWASVQVLAEHQGPWTLAQARDRVQDFQAPPGPVANLGQKPHAIWLRLPGIVANGDGHWVLLLDYPPLDRIDVWLIGADGLVQAHTRMGDHLPDQARPAGSLAHAWPVHLQPGQHHELWVRVQSSSTLLVPIHWMKERAFHQAEADWLLVQGLMIGGGLCLMLYSLMQWAATRDRMFVWYGCLAAANTLYFAGVHGIGSRHLWGYGGWLTDHAPPLAALIGVGAALMLCDRLLSLDGLNRRLGQAARTVALLAFGLAGLLLLRIVDFRTAHLAATALVLAPALVAVPAGWWRWRQGDRAALFVMLGWLAYGLGLVPTALLLRGLIDANAFTREMLQVATVVEMATWLYVLGLRTQESRCRADTAERATRAMEVLAFADALTGLPNRRGLRQALEVALQEGRSRGLMAVYLGDLDGFKAVNDRLGHDAGDELLVAVARRLQGALQHEGLVARLGGDEFVVLATGVASEAAAQQIGRRLVQVCDSPFALSQQSVQVGLSLGVVIARRSGDDATTLLRRADEAMYRVKRARRAPAGSARQTASA